MSNRTIILLLLAATITVMLVLRIQGNPLSTAQAPLGILSLEFSGDASQTGRIVHDWKQGLQQVFLWNMALDFIFIIFYSSFLYFASYYYLLLIPSWKMLARLVSKLALIAGCLDIFENVLMMISFNGNINTPVSMATFVVATLKFSLAAVAVLFIAIASVYAFMKAKPK